MQGKDIDAKIVEKSQKEVAQDTIIKIKNIIVDREEELKKATDKLSEVLEKDIDDITEKDSNHWDW